MLTILIRTHGKRDLTKTLQSIYNQTYSNIRIEIVTDGIDVSPNPAHGKYFYNHYCNILKEKVNEGWFMFLDSDDHLANDFVIENIAKHFDSTGAILCQMSRDNGRIKPERNEVRSGRIGLPCLILHSKYKNLADIAPVENGDYLWIKKVTDSIPYKFVQQIVVHSPKRNFGL